VGYWLSPGAPGQDPGGLQVRNEGCQFRKDPSQDVVELVGQARGLAGLAFEALNDFAQRLQGSWVARRFARLLDQGEASGAIALRGVGLAFGKDGLAIVVVAGGVANGNGFGKGQGAQKRFQVRGILAGGIEADVEMDVAVSLLQSLKLVKDELIPLLRLGDFTGWASRLQIGKEKGDVMAVTSRVETDADGEGGRSRENGHENTSS